MSHKNHYFVGGYIYEKLLLNIGDVTKMKWFRGQNYQDKISDKPELSF